MNTTERIISILDEKFGNYKQSITILSKTDENEFIVNDTEMLDWDEVSKLYGKEDNDSSSVDAIYLSLNNGVLTMYFFEFKNISLYDKFFNAKKTIGRPY